MAGSSFLIYASVLRPSVKYLESLVPGLLFLGIMVIFALSWGQISRVQWVRKLVESPIAWWVTIGAFATLTLVFYPLANGLKAIMGGWDQDECLVLGVENLIAGNNPYLDLTYLGNPCSPGFGALLLYFPFVLVGLVAITPIFWMFLSQLLVQTATPSRLHAGFFLVLVAASPMTLELLVNGSDIPVMGFGLLVVGLLLERVDQRKSLPGILLISILVGLIASMRVNFLLLLLVTSIYVILKIKEIALPFILISSVVAIVPSGIIYLMDPENFTPLHLVAKSQGIVPFPLYVIMATLTLVAIVWGAFLVVKRKIDFLGYLAMSFFPHLVILSFSSLIFGGWDFFNWEAANYLYVLTPVLSFLIASKSWLYQPLKIKSREV